MKYLSVCSGIEAASVAWHPLGWEPLAFSEIEPFPRAVLAHHYPHVPCHGDFTKLRDEAFIVNADVLVGGTPCQAFSVAGLRKSLDDDRGNLSLEYVRLADAIDDVRHDAGKPPAIIVWENVPGVLSVRDNAFGCFLAALAGEDSPLLPTGGKWTDAGVVDGPRRLIAWRVLDAQYFGLAQRRRRVFVVASAREGFDPFEVLSQRDGMQRYFAPCRKAGQGFAAGAQDGAGKRSHWDGDFPHPSLTQSHNAGGVGQSNQELFSQRGAYLAPSWPAEIAPTLNAHFGDKQGLEDQHIRGGQGYSFPQLSMCLNAGGMGRRDAETETLIPTIGCVFDEAFVDVSPTLRAGGNSTGGDRPPGTDADTADSLIVTHTLKGEGFDASEDGTGRGTPLVPVAFSAKDHGADATEDLSPTLRAMPHDASHANGGGQMAVAVPLLEVGKRTGPSSTDDMRAGLGVGEDGDPMYTLQAGARHGVAAYAFQPRIARNGRGDMGDIVNAINAQSGETGKGDAAPCVAVADTLGVGSNQTSGFESEVVATRLLVRRLVPEECESLQGFPPRYTRIPWRNKSAEDCPDGPRYKALGNSMAVPCMAWIGRRIALHLETLSTLTNEDRAA